MTLSQKFTNLEHLELYWNCRINDFCMKKLAKGCKKLKLVNLSGARFLGDSSIEALATNCKDLHSLDLTRLPPMTERGMIALASAKLVNLKYLNLYANSELSDHGFKELFNSETITANLEFLDLCGCKHVKDETIIKLCSKAPKMKFLNITWCISLTDKAMIEGVAKYCTDLELLSIFGLVNMTDAAITPMLSTPLKYSLQTFDVNGCKDIST